MTPDQKRWVMSTAGQAYTAQHIYPRMAACEAALESNYGASQLAIRGNNLFGMKQHKHATFGTMALPTREFLGGQWQEVEADFVSYPTITDCFADRMATLRRLQDVYPNYHIALTSTTPEAYIIAVSKTWSTDPERAQKVLAVYNEVFPLPVEMNLQGDT